MALEDIVLELCDGTKIPLKISLNETVLDLKRQAAKIKHMHESQFLIAFCGEMLRNSSTLASNGIRPGEILSLVICTPREFTVSLPSGDNDAVRVDLRASKEDVLKVIGEKHPEITSKFMIVIGEKEWPRDVDAGGVNDEELRIVAPSSGGDSQHF